MNKKEEKKIKKCKNCGGNLVFSPSLQALFCTHCESSQEIKKEIKTSYHDVLTSVKPKEKDEVMYKFINKEIDILISTTVIEVGVDVPNATCMVIEQADHFGISQLHQLRGRVGRGDSQSFCFLIYSKDITETGIERMKALRYSTDGFYIAEQDLKTRGPGELNGTLQAGALEFRIADLSRDMDLMQSARTEAITRILR